MEGDSDAAGAKGVANSFLMINRHSIWLPPAVYYENIQA